MLVNGCVAWNMSSKVSGIIHDKVDNPNWTVYVAESILNWVDNRKSINLSICEPAGAIHSTVSEDIPSQNWRQCVLCGLETSIQKVLELPCMILVIEC